MQRRTNPLLLVSLDQALIDNGNMSRGWLLTLQADLPVGLFQKPQVPCRFRPPQLQPLPSQKWITVALASLKEVDAINTRKAELKPGPPKRPNPPPDPPSAGTKDPPLSKKQQRAAAWPAAKNAAADGEHRFHFEGTDALPLHSKFSFNQLAASLPRPLLRTRTSFSRFQEPSSSSSAAVLPTACAAAEEPARWHAS